MSYTQRMQTKLSVMAFALLASGFMANMIKPLANDAVLESTSVVLMEDNGSEIRLV